MPIDQKQLPDDAIALRRMVHARRIETENLLRHLLAARSGKRSEQITEEQLALFGAELKAQGVNVEDLSKDGGSGPDDKDPPASADSSAGASI